ncbi:MAG TPA: tetratricopeptide repeat protein [Planktothrix sp.]
MATSACCAADRAKAEAALARGQVLRDKHLAHEALGYFQLANRLDPTWWDPYYRAASVLITLDDAAGAVKQIDRGVLVDANHAELYYCRGRAYFDLGRMANADVDFDHAIRLSPNEPNMLIRYGDFEYAQSNWNKALKLFNRTIACSTPAKNASESTKQAFEPIEALALKDRGNVYMQLGKYSEAVADYTAALENKYLNVQREPILSDRAKCYDKLGEHQLAEADRKKASTKSGDMFNDLMK